MAVFWLVLDCVKAKAEWAQSLLLLRASGGQFNVYACRYRAAKVVLCALKELCRTIVDRHLRQIKRPPTPP